MRGSTESGSARRRGAAAAFLCAAGVLPLASQGLPGLVGRWGGEIKAGGQSIPLIIDIAIEAGSPKATIESPSQGAKGIPVSAISFEGSTLKVESQLIKAGFVGSLSADGTRIAGEWSQGGSSFPLVLSREGAASAPKRPQEPLPPFPYTTEEVRIENASAGVTLAGTLVIPSASGVLPSPCPAVVFATGSGPQNRDEELLGHKPFLLIADYLARRGIASLRCDDRGIGKSTGDFAAATTLDFANDVRAEFDYLASRPEVKKGEVGIIGHSEGGLIAPIVASRDDGVSFVVLLAGPALPGEQILYLQGAAIARASGRSQAEIADALGLNRILYGIAKAGGEASEIKGKAKQAYLDWVDANRSLDPEAKAKARQSADAIVAPLASPWFREFLVLDPAPYLAKLTIPVLALYGSSDLQVPAEENLAALAKALGRGPKGSGEANPKDRLLELPGLNHLFQHSKTGNPAEYASIEETFAPEALKTIADWILGL